MRIIFHLSFLIILAISVETIGKEKRFKIYGTKIYSSSYLINELKLDQFTKISIQPKPIIKRLKSFYHNNGYTLAQIFIKKRNRDYLWLYIDEGRIGKLSYKDVSTIELAKIKFRTKFQFPKKIYNKFTADKIMRKLKKKYGFTSIDYKIIRDKKHDQSRFQIDRDLDLPVVNFILGTKLFYRYNIEIYSTKKYNSYGKYKKGLFYKLKARHYTGFVNTLIYSQPDFLFKKDSLKLSGDIGIMYLLDGDFATYPKWRLVSVGFQYYIPPLFGNFFTPDIFSSIGITNASRMDFNLQDILYYKYKGMLNPGITLLKKFKINLGFGIESLNFISSDIEKSNEYFSITNDYQINYFIFNLTMALNFNPFIFFNPDKNSITFTYNLHDNIGENGKSKNFNTLTLSGEVEKNFKNNDIYIFRFEYKQLFNDPFFLYETAVDRTKFRGFKGKYYYTKLSFTAGNQYSVSIYRDFFYMGLFFDYIVFNGKDPYLDGREQGIVGGISGSFIFLDQVSVKLYYGWDYLFSKKESQGNFAIWAYINW